MELKRREFHVVRYRTLRDCLAEYFGCKPAEVPKRGHWHWTDMDGKRHKDTMAKTMRRMRNRGCWGWCEGKAKIHVWINSRCKPIDAIALIAHEIGHTQKPFRVTSDAEERKANTYESVAKGAIQVYGALFVDRRK